MRGDLCDSSAFLLCITVNVTDVTIGVLGGDFIYDTVPVLCCKKSLTIFTR